MKTIVAATDFSTAANRAAHLAAQLATAQNAALVLTTAFHFWPTNPDELGGDFPLSAQAMHDDCQHQLELLARAIRAEQPNAPAIRCVVKEGYAIPAIRLVTETEKADLLVMATVGTSPQSAQLMGSVASEMVTETTVPLLLLPPSGARTQFQNAVLGIDLNTPLDAIRLDVTLRLAREFECVVNVLCIVDKPTDPMIQRKAEHIRHLLLDVPHTLTLLSGEEVYETLLQFAHDNKADLLMMLPQPHNWFRRLFVDGHTERVARLTDLPLLTVGC